MLVVVVGGGGGGGGYLLLLLVCFFFSKINDETQHVLQRKCSQANVCRRRRVFELLWRVGLDVVEVGAAALLQASLCGRGLLLGRVCEGLIDRVALGHAPLLGGIVHHRQSGGVCVCVVSFVRRVVVVVVTTVAATALT